MVMTCWASGVGLIPGSNEVTSVPLAATSSAAGAGPAAPSQATRRSAPNVFTRFSRDPLMERSSGSAIRPEQQGPDLLAISHQRCDIGQRAVDRFREGRRPTEALERLRRYELEEHCGSAGRHAGEVHAHDPVIA